ncbi:MAG: hypothetical protein R3321_02130 [Nitrososphaeraceae archaeon]|nr:hypothetical protein [Nitrososphaeraceae archaeon]
MTDLSSQLIYLTTILKDFSTFYEVKLAYNPTTLVVSVNKLSAEIGSMRALINKNLDKFTVPITIKHAKV